MSKYRPPIEVTFDDISDEYTIGRQSDIFAKKIINEFEDQIVCKVRKITEIKVDKERLENALLLDKYLVHCKDCKWWGIDGMNYCTRVMDDFKMGFLMGSEDFCSRGEKR